MSYADIFIATLGVGSVVFALLAWVMWRQFEFYDKRDDDDDANP